MGRWRRRVRSLGEAFVEVLQAELESFFGELQTTGRGWGKGLLFFIGAVAFAFWGVGVLAAFAVAVLAVWLSVWQAAGIVFLLLAGTAAGLAWWGSRLFRAQRTPTAILKGHVDDHLGWWRESLAAERPALKEGEDSPPRRHRRGKGFRKRRRSENQDPEEGPENGNDGSREEGGGGDSDGEKGRRPSDPSPEEEP